MLDVGGVGMLRVGVGGREMGRVVLILVLRGGRWGSRREVVVAGRGVRERRVAVDMMMVRGDRSGIYTRRHARPVHDGGAG